MRTNYLKLGLKRIIFSLFLISCADIDYSADSDWIYINQSQYEIAIVLGSGEYIGNNGENFTLKPQTQDTVKIYTFSRRDDLKASDFDSPYSYHGATLTIDGKSYKIEEPKGIAGIQNYESRKLGDNYFQFTYTFTDEYIEELLKSKQEQE